MLSSLFGKRRRDFRVAGVDRFVPFQKHKALDELGAFIPGREMGFPGTLECG
jgi:hypothetical protein